MNNSLCAKLCQIVSICAKTVSKCAHLCQIINLILFLMTENYLANIDSQTMPKCSDVCKSVRNCAQLYRK